MEPSSRQADLDALARQQIPGYSSLARLSVSLLAGYPALQPPGSQVLVVGCGTGAELREAQSIRPDWALTGVDPAASMLDEARRRLGGSAEQVRWVDSRVEDLAGEASYGAAIAVLVLQELPDDGSKLAFLSALARLLQPGAPLVLVDVLAGSGGLASGTSQQFQAALKRFQGEGHAEATAAPTPLHLVGEARRSALLAAAGFSDPLRFYQALQVEGVVVQKRP